MTRQWDILIVGAGIVGVCSAWYLTQAGYRPLVIDRGEVTAGNSIEQLLEKWQDPEVSIYLPAVGDPHLSDRRRRLRAAAEPIQ